MPRPSNFNQVNPQQAIAICTAEQAAQLVDYDQHHAVVSGQPGRLLTAEWRPLEEHSGPFVLTVVFHRADDLPMVPPKIQAIVDSLKFQVRGGPR